MSKQTYKEIKSAIPNIKSEKVEDISDELDRILTIKRLFTSNDGKELIKTLKQNCYIALNKLIIASKENPELGNLLAIIATYSANIYLLAQLQDIKMEEELRKQLDDAVMEAMQ
jgi:hypothetical protein